jgi:carbon starvation protein
MLFVLTMSFLAGCVTLVQFFVDGNYLLVGLDVVVLVTSLFVMLEAGSVIVVHRRERKGSSSGS